MFQSFEEIFAPLFASVPAVKRQQKPIFGLHLVVTCLGVVVRQAIWLMAAVYPYCQYCASFGLVVSYCGLNILQCSAYPCCFCPSRAYDVILIFLCLSLQGHAVAGYAPLITAYIKVLMSRITFTIKVSTQWMVRENGWLNSSSFSPAESRNSRHLELRGQALPSAV